MHGKTTDPYLFRLLIITWFVHHVRTALLEYKHASTFALKLLPVNWSQVHWSRVNSLHSKLVAS